MSADKNICSDGLPPWEVAVIFVLMFAFVVVVQALGGGES